MPAYIITYKTIDDVEREQEIFAEDRADAIRQFQNFSGQHEDFFDYPMMLHNAEGDLVCDNVDAFTPSEEWLSDCAEAHGLTYPV